MSWGEARTPPRPLPGEMDPGVAYANIRAEADRFVHDNTLRPGQRAHPAWRSTDCDLQLHEAAVIISTLQAIILALYPADRR